MTPGVNFGPASGMVMQTAGNVTASIGAIIKVDDLTFRVYIKDRNTPVLESKGKGSLK